jgi:hypothetical protein
MDTVESVFCYKFYYTCSIQIQGQLVCRKAFTHLRENFDSMQKSSKFLLEIMTLVSSADIMGVDEVFSVGGRSLM